MRAGRCAARALALVPPAVTHAAAAALALLSLLNPPAAGAAGAQAAGSPARERSADAPHANGGIWISVGLLAGPARMDARLADYQWDASPRAAWGAQTMAGRGRIAAGLRLWRTRATQRLGLSGIPDPTIHATSVECLGQALLATTWDTRIVVTGSVGRLHLGYDPARITIPSPGPGGPVEVRLASVDEWIAGGGVGFRRPLAPRWTVGLDVERRLFGLDVAHRSGAVIVNARESFGDWSAHLELARILTRH